jgi:hypothetical protein
MIAIFNSGRPGFAGVLVDTEKKLVIADLEKVTDGWGIATQYKKKNGMRCKTERVAERFTGFDGAGYHDDDTGEFVATQKPRVAEKYKVCERFEFMADLIDMVIADVSPSAIVTGPAGVGKTFEVEQGVSRCGVPQEQVTVIKGYTTPLGLYRCLHDNRNGLIIFDDCDSAFQDQIARNLLKAALDSVERRIICWNSSKLPDEFEPTFEFKGRILFVSNIPINRFDPTLISRSMIIDLQMSREEIVSHIEKIAPAVKIHLNKDVELKPSKTEIKEVVSFLKDSADSISDLNIRTYIKVMKIRRHKADGNWKGMAEYMTQS